MKDHCIALVTLAIPIAGPHLFSILEPSCRFDLVIPSIQMPFGCQPHVGAGKNPPRRATNMFNKLQHQNVGK